MGKKIIRDFRVRKSITFSLYNGKIDEEQIAPLLATRALYCIIDSDFEIYRYRNKKIEKTKIDVTVSRSELLSEFVISDLDIDEFEMHYIRSVVGENVFKNNFF